MKTATIHQTKTHLSRMLKEVQAGETIVILDGSTPVAKLTALDRPMARRPKVGTRTSAPVRYSSDAFRPLSAEESQEWGFQIDRRARIADFRERTRQIARMTVGTPQTDATDLLREDRTRCTGFTTNPEQPGLPMAAQKPLGGSPSSPGASSSSDS